MSFTLSLPYSPHLAITTWFLAKVALLAHKTPSKSSLKFDELYFSPNQIRALVRPLGVTVECLKGSVWITIDGDSRDVILGAGESTILDREQRTLIMALGDAQVRCINKVAF
jgi:hypothetical protein